MQAITPKTFVTDGPLTMKQLLEKAANVVAEKFVESDAYCNPAKVKEFLKFKLHQHDREVFGIMFLTSQHRLIDFQELFFGTINSTNVYPREIVKAALEQNAAAVILAHNHPSGDPDPSAADIRITHRIKEALELIDVQVLDHIIVGRNALSLAERGML